MEPPAGRRSTRKHRKSGKRGVKKDERKTPHPDALTLLLPTATVDFFSGNPHELNFAEGMKPTTFVRPKSDPFKEAHKNGAPLLNEALFIATPSPFAILNLKDLANHPLLSTLVPPIEVQDGRARKSEHS